MTTDIVQLKEKGKPVYLKTHAAAIDGVAGLLVRADGSDETVRGIKNFQDGIKVGNKSLDASLMDRLLNVGKKVWSGAWYAGENQSITPSLPLDQCLSGWLFLYQPYDSSAGQARTWDMNYVFVPKTHAVEFGGYAVVHHLETLNGTAYNKYVYISNTQILGHKNNNTTAKSYVLTRVYAI
ncbi:TPA: hypothetical protein P5Y24_002754 [Enterococcus faecalis]|nr:hypothetical protein [Enterococcus faecalis]